MKRTLVANDAELRASLIVVLLPDVDEVSSQEIDARAERLHHEQLRQGLVMTPKWTVV